jgi:hypothetical protein
VLRTAAIMRGLQLIKQAAASPPISAERFNGTSNEFVACCRQCRRLGSFAIFGGQ